MYGTGKALWSEAAQQAANQAQQQATPTQSGRQYSRSAPVSFETWQTELAFERTPGGERETQARNSGDARYWYDNYVKTWNASDANTRYAIDQQHGFFGGTLLGGSNGGGGQGGSGGGGGGKSSQEPAPAPSASIDPPKPQQISADPVSPESTNSGSDLTPESSATTIQQEVVEDAEKPVVEADTEAGVKDDNADTDYTVRSQDEETNDEDDSLLTVRDVTPEDEVVDPATGTRYATPADARRAGITNWVYAYQYTADDEESGG